ncbi:long-chain fatty acid--CoA ligase [Endozoicomonas montiporae]|uniref:Long-chain-fatty-acid--CoA ligase n=2 Tax=Endozoicomonas montiporae TaxID=1027273 RepID=A0A081NBF2_9GAMM|nr:AMP-binding protein [Endozoicomonas montiporae]AMO56052.1 long-chain-fatty-acid--CoA ligase [Endozoicomonas montiporae CL-33]KEQ15775.1 long-chain fatty acid--CoA ligase [Endozoicomonas montiporae]
METSFWSGKRPEGVANTVDPDSYPNVLALINSMLARNASRPAFTSIGHTLTFADIDQYSHHFAAYLQSCRGLKPGDRIAIQMPNLLQYCIAVYGAFRAGLVVVNTNPLYTAREMLHQFRDSEVKALVYLENFAHLIEEVVEDTSIEVLIATQLADILPAPKRQLINFAAKYVKKTVPPHGLKPTVTFREALKKGGILTYQPPEDADLNEPAVLQYTGGTTGVAKGAVLTHRNLIANMLQAKEVLSQKMEKQQLGLEPGKEIIVAPLPLYHIYAFTVHLLCMPYLGNRNILIANPRDTETFIKFIKPWRFTGFVGLNTLFVSLMNHPDFAECNFSGLKFTLSGGTALQEDTGLRWHKFTGCRVSEAYGLTECTPAVCINPMGELSQLGTAGLPVPDTALKIVADSGDELPVGEVGELCVKGPQVMKGYWKNDEATRKAIDENGWLRTGDVALIQDDGFVRIVDRIKDMILVSGFNVYPNEIEDVVSGFDKIDNCAAIGVPDDKTGEAVKLFVIPKDKELGKNEVIDYCRQHLAGYKVPKQIEFRDELPMTPVGKILRKDLRREERSKG